MVIATWRKSFTGENNGTASADTENHNHNLASKQEDESCSSFFSEWVDSLIHCIIRGKRPVNQ
jgi:hypothetical protein